MEVMNMLERIRSDKLTIDEAVRKAKDKNDPFRLSGFGHRVYKTFDPRAKIAKRICLEVMETTHKKDPLLDIAMELEEKATHDDYFVSRNLYPNVDFYTGITFRMLGIPANLYTVMFAMGRLPGWIAHYLEWRHDEYMKIGKTFRLPSKDDFVAAISIRKIEPKLYVNTRTGKKSQRDGYDALIKKSVCPVWKRHEV